MEFTAKMEEEFDKVAVGEEKWKNVIREFYTPFAKVVEKVEKDIFSQNRLTKKLYCSGEKYYNSLGDGFENFYG